MSSARHEDDRQTLLSEIVQLERTLGDIAAAVAQLASRHVTPAMATAVAAPSVIDCTEHEVRDGDARVSLRSRALVRRLLYGFLAKGDRHLDRDAITRTLWGCEYDPLRHASSVKNSIRRLRVLLAPTRLTIVTTETGYRLELPRGTIIVSAAAR